jgi:uncharacterized protein YjbI with pentapeptide repeats
MRPLSLLVVLAALAVALPAQAQNAGQIARARAGGSCPGCNLFQADFGGLQMRARNFSGARLRQADLSLTVMNRTTLAGADLRDVEAYGGVFTGTDFAGANLTNASFVGTFLRGANFRGATLQGANFSGAEMEGVVGLSQAQLNQACGDTSTVLPRGLRIRPC